MKIQAGAEIASTAWADPGFTHPSHFLVVQMVKNPPAMMETWVQPLGREDLLRKGMATHSSILSGEFQGRGLAKSPTQLSD